MADRVYSSVAIEYNWHNGRDSNQILFNDKTSKYSLWVVCRGHSLMSMIVLWVIKCFVAKNVPSQFQLDKISY